MPKMEVRSTECIREYIEHFYQGGLIGISDMSDYCHIIEGELYKTLLGMQLYGELKVIKRYFCPEFHQVDLCDGKSYCEFCKFLYPNNQLEVAIYVQPLNRGVTK